MTRTTDDIDIDNLSPIVPTRRDDKYEDPNELVDSVFSTVPLPRWKANAMAIGLAGGMNALHEVYQMVRNDAAEVEARANEIEARMGLVQHLCDQIAEMQQRINTLADALEARHKADAEAAEREEAQRIQDELNAMPDPDDPDPLAHHPGGELHAIVAKVEDQGDLPEELQEPSVPPEPPEPPEVKGFVYPQPVSVQLNKE